MTERGFVWLILIIVIAVVLLFGFKIAFEHSLVVNPKETSNNSVIEIPTLKPQDNNCKDGEIPKFEAEFTDLEKINGINPIGGIVGGSPGRSYIGVKKGMMAPIYAPTDAVLENVIYARRGGPSTLGEYGLYIRLNCNITILFDHIDKVSERILAVAPKEPAENSRTDFDPVNLPIKKGELLGYTDGTPQARTFDFLLIDRSKPVTHINPKRWEWEQAVYAQCPYDYFIPELKERYYQKIGEVGEIGGIPSFTPAGNCGKLSHDKLGTISGGWFKGNSTDTKGDYLAIARDGSKVSIAQRKDGDFPEGMGEGESKLRDYSSKVSPEDIGIGEEVCYSDQNHNKWIYVKLVSEKELSLVRGEGSCPVSFPQSQAEVWER